MEGDEQVFSIVLETASRKDRVKSIPVDSYWFQVVKRERETPNLEIYSWKPEMSSIKRRAIEPRVLLVLCNNTPKTLQTP